MDIQAGMLAGVQRKAEVDHLHNIQFLQAGAGEGKLGENHFDKAVPVTVPGEIPDREAGPARGFWGPQARWPYVCNRGYF